MKNNARNILISLLTFSLLSGCTNYSTKFDCKAGKGFGCKSISQVDQIIDQKQALRALDQQEPSPSPTSLSTAKFGSPGHQKLRVWIAPYKDAKGNWHEASSIYTTIPE